MRSGKKRLVSCACVLGVLSSPILLGDETVTPGVTSTHVPPDSVGVVGEVSPDMIRELSQLRKEVGRSALSGSLLDIGDSADDFKESLRSALGLPADPKLSTQGTQVVNDHLMAIRTIRQQCKTLDEIAHQLELQRHYDRADKLRESARKLREVARYLDR